MICQSCGKKNAVTHIKQIVNGEIQEYYLCADCAAKLGYGSLLGGFSLNIGDLIGSVLGEGTRRSSNVTETRCPCCGCTFSDIVRSGRVGCAQCYDVFRDRLLPSIQRIHGNTHHVGCVPVTASKKAQQSARLEEVRKKLAQAIEKENFEEAVTLRDEIRAMEDEVKEGGQDAIQS